MARLSEYMYKGREKIKNRKEEEITQCEFAQ